VFTFVVRGAASFSTGQYLVAELWYPLHGKCGSHFRIGSC